MVILISSEKNHTDNEHTGDLAIIVLVCVGLDIVILVLTMQVMLRLDDVATVETIALPSILNNEPPSTITNALIHF
jgi:hypothetical protein